MASVRMTGELGQRIYENAMTAFRVSNPHPEPSTAFQQLVKTAVVNAPLQVFLKEMRQIGIERGLDKESHIGRRHASSVLPRIRHDDITSVSLHGACHTDSGAAYDANVDVSLITPITDYLNGGAYGSIHVYIDQLEPEHIPTITDLFHKLVDARKIRGDNEDRYRLSIKDLVSRCTTLKQLLEVWPAAENLVPANKIQQMHTKVTRVQRAKQIKEEVNFDATAANQVILTAKMLGG
tara:strand:+ start:1074 stop:1784 length:711 start_codon:yes stop_codon:yes gene_type:complete